MSSWNVLPFSIAFSCEKVCGGENRGSGGGKLCKPTLVISLKPKPSWTINELVQKERKSHNKQFLDKEAHLYNPPPRGE